jgi:hypothetical protein
MRWVFTSLAKILTTRFGMKCFFPETFANSAKISALPFCVTKQLAVGTSGAFVVRMFAYGLTCRAWLNAVVLLVIGIETIAT